ncbi:MAG: amidohydrolase family protein, partial [Boseongicola sp. SB0664_bin_43]|nr:amidohydrolase family protein [Boseongicola sp. SB0664_bin_43]
ANPEWPMAQVVFADLASERLGKELDRMQELPSVRGVRQIVGRAPEEDRATGTNELLDDPRFVEGLREVGRRGLSFDLQLIPELYGAMADVLSDVPGTRVALCHAGSPHDRTRGGLAAWSGGLRRLSELPQVSAKLSGLGMFEHDWTRESVRPVVEVCLEQFGAARCMFGSNFPVDSLYSDYRAIVEAYECLVPDEARLAVFGDTAAAFYGLGEMRSGP